MNLGDPLLFVHALATVSLAGLIWTIQVVHYPLFLRVPSECFHAYESEHMRRITWLVGPLMLTEAIAALLILLQSPSSIPVLISTALLAIIWLSTATIQGPLHTRMAQDGFSEDRIRLLVRSNWIRTAAWTVRALIALALLGAGHGQAL